MTFLQEMSFFELCFFWSETLELCGVTRPAFRSNAIAMLQNPPFFVGNFAKVLYPKEDTAPSKLRNGSQQDVCKEPDRHAAK